MRIAGRVDESACTEACGAVHDGAVLVLRVSPTQGLESPGKPGRFNQHNVGRLIRPALPLCAAPMFLWA